MTPMSRQDEIEVAADFAHDKAKEDRITAEMEARDKTTTPEELAHAMAVDFDLPWGDAVERQAAALIADAFERWRRERADWVEAELTQAHIEADKGWQAARRLAKWRDLTLARAEAAEARVRELENMRSER